MLRVLEESRLLKALQRPEEDRRFQRAANMAYDKYKDRIAAWIVTHHQLEEMVINDIAHETLGAFLQNVRQGHYRGEGALFTYLTGIAYNLVQSYLRQQKRKAPLLELLEEMKEEQDFHPEHLFMTKEIKEQVNRLLAQLEEKCRKVLTLWMHSYKSKEIAEQLAFASAQVARVTKSRCMHNLKVIVSDNPHLLN